MSNIISFSQSLKIKTKGTTKTVNQTVNRTVNKNLLIDSLVNLHKSKHLHGSDVWFSVFETVNLLGISKQALWKNNPEKNYVTKWETGRGGKRLMIALSSLPMDVQMRWRKENGFVPPIDADDAPKSCKPYDRLSEQQRQTALDRNDVVTEYREALAMAKHGEILAAKEAFIARYTAGEWPLLLERLGSVTWKTIDVWCKTLQEHGGLSASLAPNYRYTRAGSATISVSMLQSQTVIACYLDGNQPKIAEVVRKTNKILDDKGVDQVNYNQARRLINVYKQNNEPQVVMAREGGKAYNDKCAPYIMRNNSLILPGDIMVSDGHKINFTIQHPISGRPVRMMLISHQDQATNAILGWEIMPTENTAAIASSLRRSMLWLGSILTGDEDMAFVPRVMNIDNGKAFKSAYFTRLQGDTMKELIGSGVYDQLRQYGFAGVNYSKPYNGQEKTIERFWGNFAELERSMPNYTGTSIAMKPAHLNRGEFMLRGVAERLSLNVAPTIPEAHYLIAHWMHENNLRETSKSSKLKGKSPYQALEEGINRLREKEGGSIDERLISRNDLSFLMMPQTTRVLKRNGISIFGRQYLSPELHDLAKGQRELVVRYDFDRIGSVAIYHPNGEFLCIADEYCPDGGIHPAAKLLGTPEQVEAKNKAVAIKNKLHNSTSKLVKNTIIAAAKQGYTGIVQRDVMPAVIRQQLKAAEEQVQKEAAAAQKTGTDGGYADYEEMPNYPTEEQLEAFRAKERAEKAAKMKLYTDAFDAIGI